MISRGHQGQGRYRTNCDEELDISMVKNQYDLKVITIVRWCQRIIKSKCRRAVFDGNIFCHLNLDFRPPIPTEVNSHVSNSSRSTKKVMENPNFLQVKMASLSGIQIGYYLTS